MAATLLEILVILAMLAPPILFFFADTMRIVSEKERTDKLRLVLPPASGNDGESPFAGRSFIPSPSGNPAPAPQEATPEDKYGLGPCHMVLRHEHRLRLPASLTCFVYGGLIVSGTILPQSAWGLALAIPGLFWLVCGVCSLHFMRDGLAVCLAGIPLWRHRYDDITGMRQYMRGCPTRCLVAWRVVEQRDYEAGKGAGFPARWHIVLTFRDGETLDLSTKEYPGLKEAVIYWIGSMG